MTEFFSLSSSQLCSLGWARAGTGNEVEVEAGVGGGGEGECEDRSEGSIVQSQLTEDEAESFSSDFPLMLPQLPQTSRKSGCLVFLSLKKLTDMEFDPLVIGQKTARPVSVSCQHTNINMPAQPYLISKFPGVSVR